MKGHRQAAAALHGLASRDQEWIVNALAPQDREVVLSFLGELDALGFDGGPFSPVAAKDNSAAPDPRERVRQASAGAMAAALGHEAASLLACVLRIQAWPWTPAFMELLPPARRALVLAQLNRPARPAPARERMLLEHLAAMLGTTIVTPVVPGAVLPTLFERMRTWMR